MAAIKVRSKLIKELMVAANNQRVLLDKLLEQRQADRAVPLEDYVAFEVFCAEQSLREFDVSQEELIDGNVGGGRDGGLDGIYTFLDGHLLTEDDDIFDADSGRAPRREAPLDLILIQAKQSQGFPESALVNARSSLDQLLDFDAEESDLRVIYNDRLVDKAILFRRALIEVASRHPKISVRFVYSTRGDTSEIGAGPKAKAKQLQDALGTRLGTDTAEVEFLGATELWKRANKVTSYTLNLNFEDHITMGASYVALVSIGDYLDFICNDDRTLKRHIFEMNVRDYQGEVEVNREISRSLLDHDSAEFWWLNNGVTVVCSFASTVMGKSFRLDDVQIVNGLQTSFTMYETLKSTDRVSELFQRHVLVRILVTGDAKVRDQVIRATNRQTNVPLASLYATDDHQREIEMYLLQFNWFYDRRKNYYKNTGKNRDRIVSISFLAQAMMAIALGEPNQARARPSSLLKRQADYEKVFPPKLNLAIYRYCLELQVSVDNYLTQTGFRPADRANLKFHLASLVAAQLLGAVVRSPSQLHVLASNQALLDGTAMYALVSDLMEWRQQFSRRHNNMSYEQIAKSGDFVDYMWTRYSSLGSSATD